MKPRPRPPADDEADVLAWFCGLLLDALSIPDIADAIAMTVAETHQPDPPPPPVSPTVRVTNPVRGVRTRRGR